MSLKLQTPNSGSKTNTLTNDKHPRFPLKNHLPQLPLSWSLQLQRYYDHALFGAPIRFCLPKSE